MHPHREAPRPTIAVIGGESLSGKEVTDLLESAGLPATVRPVTDDEGEGAAASSRVLVLAGPTESSRRAFDQFPKGNPVVDLIGALEDHPTARLRAPMVEPSGYQAADAIQVIAHPAAIAIALLLTELRKAGAIRKSVVHVFEPVSERGKAGIDELQRQVVSLLSFKPMVTEVFHAQAAFNLLARYGPDSPHTLEQIELKIERHLASLLAASGPMPMPSLRLIQAPVFHAYSISIWAEFEKDPGIAMVNRVLASKKAIDVRPADDEPPNNVGVAGQGGIQVGAIAADRNHAGAYWFWVVADNLRIAAENAVEVVRALL